jgi:hypothetical protein
MKVRTAKRRTATAAVPGWMGVAPRPRVLGAHPRRTQNRQPHDSAAMVLAEDPTTEEVVICSVWGLRTDWVRNLRANPPLLVRIGRQSYVPQHRFLTDEEAFAVGVTFRRRHPGRLRMVKLAFGVDLRSDDTLREFVRTRPFVALRPLSTGRK